MIVQRDHASALQRGAAPARALHQCARRRRRIHHALAGYAQAARQARRQRRFQRVKPMGIDRFGLDAECGQASLPGRHLRQVVRVGGHPQRAAAAVFQAGQAVQ